MYTKDMELKKQKKSRVITVRVEESLYKRIEKLSEEVIPEELKESNVNKVNWYVKKMIIDRVLPGMALNAVIDILREAQDGISKPEAVKALEPEWGLFKNRIDRDFEVAEFDKKVFDKIDKIMKEIKTKGEKKGKGD